MKLDTPYCFVYISVPDVVQKSCYTPNGAMDPTFPMNYVQPSSMFVVREIKQTLWLIFFIDTLYDELSVNPLSVHARYWIPDHNMVIQSGEKLFSWINYIQEI